MPLNKIALLVPEALLQSLEGVQGFSKESFVAVHASGAQVTSVRVHPTKKNWLNQEGPGETIKQAFNQQVAISPVPWCDTGFYLSQRPSFTLNPLFHAGAYYVQESSSMFLEQVIKQQVPLHNSNAYRVLDLCAAPGGKSTHLSSLFQNGLIVANEVIKIRSGILTENIIKWGNTNVVVTSNDAEDFKRLPGYFDVVVVDAPCSGSGMFRKDKEAIDEWSLQNVDYCSKRQQRILEDVWPCLKENGLLIYSTCSYSAEENEEILDWLHTRFEVESKRIKLEQEWGIVETVAKVSASWGYRFYPDKVKGEGLFIACMEKKEPTSAVAEKGKKLLNPGTAEKKVLEEWIVDAAKFDYFLLEDEILAAQRSWIHDISVLMQLLYVRKAGVRVGKMIRTELIPDHELAVSGLISAKITLLPVDLDTALQYLRKLEMKGNAGKGWALVMYDGFGLGWVKVLPNRINNYYPQRFRILKH